MKDISSRNTAAYEKAFDVLNEKAFDGKLPSVVLTLRAGRNTNGYAWAKRFRLHDKAVSVEATAESSIYAPVDAVDTGDDSTALFDEIAINPATAARPARDVLGTLLHEMCHVWQFNFGKLSRNGYHNAQWAGKMLEVGLKPFNVENPDKMVGQKVTHTIEVDGLADLLFREIEAQFGADLVVELPTADKAKKPAKNSKVKFTCPECGANAWGKDTLILICGACDQPMLSDADEGGDVEGDEL